MVDIIQILILCTVLFMKYSGKPVSAKGIECPTETENKCEKFWHRLLKYPGHNLKKGLKCLDYDKNIAPSETHGNNSIPTEIFMKALDITFLEINDEKEYGLMESRVSAIWYDHRLKFPKECLTKQNKTNFKMVESDVLNILWNPMDIFLKILMRGKHTYNKFITIGEDGKIITMCSIEEKYQDTDQGIEQSVTVKFDFTWYPFDTQKFIIPMPAGWNTPYYHFKASVSNQTNLLSKDWDVDITYGTPIPISMELEVFDIEFNGYFIYNTYLFRRPLTNHFLQTFIPSMMLSIASASSVFIPPDVVPARMSLCITSFLSLISLFNGARNDWTKTTHMRAIDVWVIFCYIGVFSALMEYCVILYLTKTAIFDQKSAQVKDKELIYLNQEKNKKILLKH